MVTSGEEWPRSHEYGHEIFEEKNSFRIQKYEGRLQSPSQNTPSERSIKGTRQSNVDGTQVTQNIITASAQALKLVYSFVVTRAVFIIALL